MLEETVRKTVRMKTIEEAPRMIRKADTRRNDAEVTTICQVADGFVVISFAFLNLLPPFQSKGFQGREIIIVR